MCFLSLRIALEILHFFIVPYKIKIWCNPKRVKAGGVDTVDIQIEVLDIINNPIINTHGMSSFTNHFLYKDVRCNLYVIACVPLILSP